MRRRVLTAIVALALVSSAIGVTGCGMPPALTKAQLDAKVLPKKHPNISEQNMKNCRGCHKEAPAIRK